jgi:hypothetical protein
VTNKRKSLIRQVAKRAGVSHAGAANILNKTRLVIDPTPHEPTEVFAVDTYSLLEIGPKQVGCFKRVNLHIYEKAPNDTAYIIGPEGEYVLAIEKPKTVIIPMVTYEANTKYVDPTGKMTIEDFTKRSHDLIRKHLHMAVLERMLAVLEAAATKGYSQALPEVPQTKAKGWFKDRFRGQSGTVRLVFDARAQTLFGVLDQAGVILQQGAIFGNFGGSRYVGLMTLGSRVEGLKLV